MKKYGLFLLFVVVAVLSRLAPHPANVSPLVALGLFAGIVGLNRKITFLLVIGSLLLSDLFLASSLQPFFYPGMAFVYGALALIVLLSSVMKWGKSWGQIFTASVGSSVIFFVVSNFGVWFSADFYAKNFDGLVQCYVMALPFFHRSLLGDLFYVTVLFVGYKIIADLKEVKSQKI